MKTIKVGVTGGIGSGKSYVCKIFQDQFGIKVYDADRRTQDDIILRENVRNQIINNFGIDSYIDNKLNKEKFKKLLFSDKSALDKMNKIIKPELTKDINNWVNLQSDPYVIVECAIIFENNFEDIFDKIVVVTSPIGLRIERLIKRGLSYDNISKIINVQLSDDEKIEKSDFVIVNDDSLLDQIKKLDKTLSNEKPY